MSLTDGLVGAWVPSLGPTAGILLDRSAYSNHGTLTNMDPATDWQASGSGWSLDFDGGNDHIPCGNRINASLANHLTLAMWARFDKISGTQGVISTVSSGGGAGQQLELGRQTGKFIWLQNAFALDAVATNAITAGEHFVALTRTGTTGNWTITFFIDDQPADEHTTSVNQRSDDGLGNFTIGRPGDYNGQYFDGAVHGAAAWQRALTPAEIKSLHQAGPGDWLARKRRRVYAFTGPAFKAAWATRATTIAGVLQ